jgi:hypothetical protein
LITVIASAGGFVTIIFKQEVIAALHNNSKPLERWATDAYMIGLYIYFYACPCKVKTPLFVKSFNLVVCNAI